MVLEDRCVAPPSGGSRVTLLHLADAGLVCVCGGGGLVFGRSVSSTPSRWSGFGRGRA